MLEERLNKDYIQAMKDKNRLKSETLNFIRAQVKNYKINEIRDVNRKLEDVDVINIIKKQVKQREDSINQFKAGGREDLVENETNQLAILKEYLPEELSDEAIKDLVDQAIKEVGATSIRDMGKVMKIASEKANGCADNKKLSEIVKSLLG